MYSPIIDDVKMRYHEVRFDGRFADANVFRGEPPSPEVDKAWESLGVGYRPVMISDDKAYRSGLTTNHTRRNSKYGGGYPVYVEGLHQLHCLNLLRKSLYYNYEYYHTQGKGPFSDPDKVLHWHVSHCVDFIRQRLMCDVDIGVFGSVWVNRTDPRPFVDFNTRHVCRDFEAVRAWAERHQVDDGDGLPGDFWEPIGEGTYVWDVAP
ncbi:hypothetical protein B0T14DRAFT_586967 [Immersiella caudata]|uniref:Tat pathway signal sequence n=1 Tax=Immersiella caudata TaxID=314043 RepID=A0AA40C0I2_9PEZI|nr:hypothetical protein B0T14DRAFT_586967 [Immersiella caudata]